LWHAINACGVVCVFPIGRISPLWLSVLHYPGEDGAPGAEEPKPPVPGKSA